MILGLASGKIVATLAAIAVATIAGLGWLLLEAKQSQGRAEATAAIATGANHVWQKAWSAQQQDLKAQQERLDAIDQRLAASSRESRRRLDALNRGLNDAIQSSDEVRAWAGRRRPQPVLDGLCRAGYIDPAARDHVCGDPAAPNR